MGGSAAKENNFWELFVRPAATAAWQQATPPGVADNGGLVVTSPAIGSLLTGFRPSQDLTFSPLAASGNDGANWAPAGLVSPGLASLPDALAAGPGGRLLALTNRGGAQLAVGPVWTRLSSVGALATTAAGKACGLTALTAAAFSRSGTPVLAGVCSRPGVAGIFADRAGGWRPAGPAVAESMARQTIDVVRLTATGSGLVALLRAGTGAGTSLIAAFALASDTGSQWTLSAPVHIGTAQLRSATVGPGFSVAVILDAATGLTLTGPGASWLTLPALPRWTATLALGPSGAVDAVAAHASTFSDWLLTSGSARSWRLTQTLPVTIPYGTSG